MSDNLVASVRRLVELLQDTECIYLHDRLTGKVVAMVIPIPGWWVDQLPEAPPGHFDHDHYEIDNPEHDPDCIEEIEAAFQRGLAKRAK